MLFFLILDYLTLRFFIRNWDSFSFFALLLLLLLLVLASLLVVSIWEDVSFWFDGKCLLEEEEEFVWVTADPLIRWGDRERSLGERERISRKKKKHTDDYLLEFITII